MEVRRGAREKASPFPSMKNSLLTLCSLVLLGSLAQAEEFDLKASIERGKGVYMQTCITCHQPTGLGLPGVFPPLAGTESTGGEARRMIAMTLKGVNPPLKVKEMTYAVPMPPLPTQFPILVDDNKLADVINFVRNSFGNKDEKGVTPAMIDEVRKEFAGRTTPWTEAELQKFPEKK